MCGLLDDSTRSAGGDRLELPAVCHAEIMALDCSWTKCLEDRKARYQIVWLDSNSAVAVSKTVAAARMMEKMGFATAGCIEGLKEMKCVSYLIKDKPYGHSEMKICLDIIDVDGYVQVVIEVDYWRFFIPLSF